MPLILHIPWEPKPQMRHRSRVHYRKVNGVKKPYTQQFEDPLMRQWKDWAAAHVRRQVRQPLSGPLCCDAVFLFPRDKNKIWKTKPMVHYWHDVRPDRDNLEKAVLDALNGLVWHDDSQICAGTIYKVRADWRNEPGTWLRVEQLGERCVLPRWAMAAIEKTRRPF